MVIEPSERRVVMDELPEPRRIDRSMMTWLEAESRHWVAEGLLDDSVRHRILAGYTSAGTPHRGTTALVLVAVLMCAFGVLLVIGYNWQLIPAAAKIAMILASIAGAFGGAAIACDRRRQTLAEVLAFAGTLLFGNGIWLIAQVLHIQGHYPDGFLWFGVGTVATASLVRSKAIGIEAAILIAAWIAAETSFYPHPIYRYLILWPAAVYVAYQLRSPVMLRVLALSAAFWVLVSTLPRDYTAALPGAVALTGTAMYTAGRWHSSDHVMAGAWRTSGLVVLLLAFLPLMSSGWRSHPDHLPDTVVLSITAVIAAAAFSIVPRIADAVDWTMVGVTFFITLWTAATWLRLPEAVWLVIAAKVIFSALALGIAVSLLRSAFASNRTSDLVFGVLFALAVLLVRWTSVLQNLLWSGLFLLLAGGGLLLVARSWLRRDRPAISGRTA
jgi:uncharacterized membrane protein